MSLVQREIGQSLFIGGEWVAPQGYGTPFATPTSNTSSATYDSDKSPAASIPVINPATEEILSEIGYGGPKDAVTAVEVAAEAFRTWRHTTPRQRSDLLYRTATLLRERGEEIGTILSLETGKRRQEGIGEIRFAAEYFQWFAEEVRRPHGLIATHEAQNRRHYTISQPAGVALTLTPWNFPISIQARKLAPALAAGCTVVARASQKAPLAVLELFRCLQEAGFPEGVVNLIQGPATKTTEVMFQHPAVRVVSFTGSTRVGQSLIRQSAAGVQRLALELGGDAPFLVFPDANLEQAVEGAMIAKFRNNGQSCIAANRFYVHDDVYEEFVERFAGRVSALKLGNPMENESDLGPMIDDTARRNLKKLEQEARAGGAVLLNETQSVPEQGFFIAPMLLGNVPPNTSFGCSELFGPAAPIFRFHEEDEVIAAANGTDMGLAGYVYTHDYARSIRVTEALECGIVGHNTPLPSVSFTPMGGHKKSGLGREGGHLGMEEFLEVKYVASEFEE